MLIHLRRPPVSAFWPLSLQVLMLRRLRATSANPSFFMPLRLRLWPPSPAALAYLQLTVVCLQTILALCARALHPLVLVPLFLYLGTLGLLIAAILWAFHL